MQNQRKTNLEHFIEFFSARLDFVESSCKNSIEGMILLCSYIDSLAGYRYNGKSNSQRFKRFLVEDTEQSPTWRKLSLILLRQYLEMKNLKLYSNLINVLNRLGAISSNYINLNYNPDTTTDQFLNECEKELSSEEEIGRAS